MQNQTSGNLSHTRTARRQITRRICTRIFCEALAYTHNALFRIQGEYSNVDIP